MNSLRISPSADLGKLKGWIYYVFKAEYSGMNRIKIQ